MDKRFCVIVVCYNHLIEDTEVIKTCLNLLDTMEVLIFDNSTLNNIILKNKQFSKNNGLWYLSKNQNLGLSVAYNSAIDFIKKKFHVDWITIFDQDTKVTIEYFNVLKESINMHPSYMIHAPLVCSKNGIMSPLRFTKWAQRRFDIINESYNNIACINSGLTVNKVVYENVGTYDEKLFLDLVDYDFFRRFYKKIPNEKVKILKYQIEQEFSGDSFSTFDSDYARFNIYISDFRYYCKNWDIQFSYGMYTLVKRAIKLAIHYRNFSFIKQVFKNY